MDFRIRQWDVKNTVSLVLFHGPIGLLLHMIDVLGAQHALFHGDKHASRSFELVD